VLYRADRRTDRLISYAMQVHTKMTLNMPAHILVQVGFKDMRFWNTERNLHLPIFEITFNIK